MGDKKTQYSLDHVVVLLPYDYLENPPSWIKDNFTISPGGRHGDNKTENRLILFRDGTYLELIAFINDDPEKRKGHWWDKPYGVVDYALCTTDFDFEELVSRLKATDTGITYNPPKPGGRARPDGVQLKWEVTFANNIERGYVPFFCTDVTPRERRVPITKENTSHPCGALGMGGVLQELKKDTLDRLSTATAAILGSSKREDNEYNTHLPNEVEKLKQPTIRLHERQSDSDKDLALTVVLQTAEHESRDDIGEHIDDGVVSIKFE
jgi:hypothetical protein